MKMLKYGLLVGLGMLLINSQTLNFGVKAKQPGRENNECMPDANKGGFHSLSATDDFHWQKRLASGRTVEIKGLHGNILAKAASGNEVEVTATKRGRRGEVQDVDIKVLEHENGVTICAVYPTIDPQQPYVCRSGNEQNNYGMVYFQNSDVQVDFTVRLPMGLRFIGRTVQGEVEVTLLTNDIEAFTVNGDVRVSTAGHVRATSMTGAITASLKETSWVQPLELQTVNGDIIVALLSKTNANVRAETSYGSIATDFPLNVQKSSQQRSATGTIGGGGSDLMLKTVFGSIKLIRAP